MSQARDVLVPLYRTTQVCHGLANVPRFLLIPRGLHCRQGHHAFLLFDQSLLTSRYSAAGGLPLPTDEKAIEGCEVGIYCRKQDKTRSYHVLLSIYHDCAIHYPLWRRCSLVQKARSKPKNDQSPSSFLPGKMRLID